VVEGDVKAQTERVLKNLSPSSPPPARAWIAVKTTVFLKNVGDFQA